MGSGAGDGRVAAIGVTGDRVYAGTVTLRTGMPSMRSVRFGRVSRAVDGFMAAPSRLDLRIAVCRELLKQMLVGVVVAGSYIFDNLDLLLK